MNRNKKIAEFLRREALWFFIGAAFSAMLSYTFHLGEWLTSGVTVVYLFVCVALSWFFNRRSAKQR